MMKTKEPVSEAGSQSVGLYVTPVIKIVRYLSFNCHLSDETKIHLAKD